MSKQNARQKRKWTRQTAIAAQGFVASPEAKCVPEHVLDGFLQKNARRFRVLQKVRALEQRYEQSRHFRRASIFFAQHRSRLILLGLATVLPIFAATAWAISVSSAHDNDLPKIVHSIETLALPPFESPKINRKPTQFWRSDLVREGDTLAKFLQRLDISPLAIQNFLKESPQTHPLLQLGVGAQIYVLSNDVGDILAIRFLREDDAGETALVVIQKTEHGWRPQRATPHIQVADTLRSLRLTHDGGIRQALFQAGIPAEIRAQLLEIFADRIPLETLKKGDALDVIFESFSHQGEVIGTGRVLAAEVRSSMQMTQAFYHQHDSESGGYYDLSGLPLKRGFQNTVIDNAPISSGYGMRVHPIYGDVRMHHGVDYAAPIGTPIRSPADGVVKFRGVQGGYGLILILQHDNGYQTAYAHLSSFAPNIKLGTRVRAGEWIARVGNTGRSTGPHLHFEVRLNDKAVDPSFAVVKATRLEGRDLQRFARNSTALNRKLGLLSAMPVQLAKAE